MITIQYTKDNFVIHRIFENLDKLKLFTIYDLKKRLKNFNPIYIKRQSLYNTTTLECGNDESLNKFQFEILYYNI